MEDFHRTLTDIVFRAGHDLGLVLAGGYAISAHELTTRPSEDVDFATATAIPMPMPMPEIVDRLFNAFHAAGFTVSVVEVTPRMARLSVTDSTRSCAVDVLKEAIGPPALLAVGPVLDLDDAVGMKVAALHDRAAHRDFVDVHAAAVRGGYTLLDLERLGRIHQPAWSPAALQSRLASIELRGARRFLDYGLTYDEANAVVWWAQQWAADIDSRLHQESERGPAENATNWDDYLDS
ncbi:nucleotidyl transferase AbiEii/AbiGii toxin family protein [Actinoplanes sp. NPDC051494]|uniref:nucleotidyl transferase AbiEii/AbiGii toxin family protein n=1 Tax=Actinoplanes sp. NPDC051494 TaxID=3363907 RepID=UPI00379D5EE8